MNKELFLSPSRIKLAKGCRWKYWCRYHLNLPDKSNDGADRGSICHLILEVLGRKRHMKHFKTIMKDESIRNCKPVVKLVRKHARRLGIHDVDNLKLMDEMIVSGLHHDFFGTKIGRPTISISEHSFEIKKVDKKNKVNYNIRGILDKLFIYKKKKFAIFRDFKTSKQVFKGGEVTNNLQDWMYSLAIKTEHPEVDNIRSEFIFLRHQDKSSDDERYPCIIKMEDIDKKSLQGFEHELTAYQKYLSNFSEKDAHSGFAAHAPFPKDGSFSGRLECGFAKYKGQLKKDGTLMWHCPYKFDFYYYIVYDAEDKLVKTYFEDDFNFDLVPKGGSYQQMWYSGCPCFQKNS